MNQISRQVSRHSCRQFLKEIGLRHLITLGSSGKGKSGFQRALARAIIASFEEGLTFNDPHGEAVRDTAEWALNPQHNINRRITFYTAGSDYCLSLNPFWTEKPCPQAFHESARQWASIVISCFHAMPGQLPRLERIQHCLGYIAAELRLTLVDLPGFISLGGHTLRERVIAGCSNPMVAAEWAGLADLAKSKPGQFLDQVESSLNRILQWLTSPLIKQMFGRYEALPARAIMDRREIVLIDTSRLPDVDAAFVGKCLTSLYLTAAKQREPHASATHRLLIDECENTLSIDTAKILDQARKFGLLFAGNLQRLAQLREREDGETIFDAVMSNCAVKVLFGMQEPEAAAYCADLLFTPWIDYAEEKPGSERPVAVGSERVIVRNRNHASSRGHVESRGESDMRSDGFSAGATEASMFAAGESFGSGESLAYSSSPPQQILDPWAIAGKNDGTSSSRAASSMRGASRASSWSKQRMRASARSSARATSESTSDSEGEAEAFITRYEWLPGFYTLEEQKHRLTGEIMNLPARECFVKIDDDKPYRARTADLEPAYRSEQFKTVMLPRLIANAARKSPYLARSEDVDREISARFAAAGRPDIPAEPQTWFEPADRPEPAPQAKPEPTLLDNAQKYARGFYRRIGRQPQPPLRIVKTDDS